MKTEKEIKQRIKFLEKLMKKYEKEMNKKTKMNYNAIEKYEEAEEMYNECVNEIGVLNWVLGVQYELQT